jgi:mRNA interferase MazF
MVILQGDVFWIDLGHPQGAEPGYHRPCVIIQNNAFNRSRISTVVITSITSNLKLGLAPGNITLQKGEAGLPKKCVVNISQLLTVDRAMLNEKIGKLTQTRLEDVLHGIQMLLHPTP